MHARAYVLKRLSTLQNGRATSETHSLHKNARQKMQYRCYIGMGTSDIEYAGGWRCRGMGVAARLGRGCPFMNHDHQPASGSEP